MTTNWLDILDTNAALTGRPSLSLIRMAMAKRAERIEKERNTRAAIDYLVKVIR